MKIKKALILAGILLVSNGYCGLKYEAELARKFCPSLQLHSKDQGVSPKPLHIMSNKEEEKVYRLKTETSLESIGSSEQPKKTKKGKIIGALIGAGIGGGVGYSLYSALDESREGKLKEVDKPSSLFIIIPAVVGGLSGYAIGTYHDGITRKEKLGLEQPKKLSKKGRIIGTTIGIVIGGYFGLMVSVAAAVSNLDNPGYELSPLIIIVPTAIGGILGYGIGKGYDIGKYYDKRQEIKGGVK